MPISSDIVLDRKMLTRKLKRWRAATFLSMIVFLSIILVKNMGAISYGAHISQINLNGFISGDENQQDLFLKVLRNKNSKALLLHIDSAGGSVVGGEIIHDLVRQINERIPVVVIMGGTATSAAYMVAVPSDHIFAHKGTVTGSIGVLMELPNFSGIANKVGFSMPTISSGALKGQPSYFDKITPDVEHVIKLMVDDFYDVFIDMVAEGRSLDKDKVRLLADGRVFTGRQALDNGLVDAIGGKNKALSWLRAEKGIKPSVRVVKINAEEEPMGFLELFTSYFSGKGMLLNNNMYYGLTSLWRGGSV